MTSHQPAVFWEKLSFMCRMGQGNTGPGVASISEALRVPQGLPSPNRGTPWVPWLSLHVQMLHSWALWGGLEQMTDRDTDDVGAAVHDGGIVGQSVDHAPGRFPVLKDSRPLSRSFLRNLRDSSPDTGPVILWTTLIFSWAHTDLDGVRWPGTCSDQDLADQPLSLEFRAHLW